MDGGRIIFLLDTGKLQTLKFLTFRFESDPQGEFRLDAVIEREEYTAEKTRLMSQKKSLEEQMASLTTGRADWLEPLEKWILTAKNMGKIAVSGSLQEKRVLASKVFGSNLVLDCKKARGSCVKPWSLLVKNSSSGGMVRAAGFEPSKNTRFTGELR